MKNAYITPEVTVIPTTNIDIMEGSDTFIDVGTLWNTASETDETI